jgi:transcriptional regulator with XRE-family HTH domain
MDTADAIAKLRMKLGYKQKQLASALGLTVVTISRYENGRQPTEDALRKLGKLAEEAGAPHLADLFKVMRRSDVASRVERLPSNGTARRVPVGDLALWATTLNEIENYSRIAFQHAERLGLDEIRETCRMSFTSAKALAKDVEIYIAPADKPGLVTWKRLEAISTAKAQARKI